MKKRIFVLVVMILLAGVSLVITSCVGDVVEEPKPSEPPFVMTPEIKALLNDYVIFRNRVYRWPDGIVEVYDETDYEKLPEILAEINAAIDGPTKFILSNNPNNRDSIRISTKLFNSNNCPWTDYVCPPVLPPSPGEESHVIPGVGFDPFNEGEIIKAYCKVVETSDYSDYVYCLLNSAGIYLVSASDATINGNEIPARIKQALWYLYRLEPGFRF